MSKKQEKTVWVLSELYYPEETGSGYYITKIAENIATRRRVRVVTVQPTYAARGIKAPVDEVHHNVQIHRCGATALNKDILLFRLLNLLTISVSVFFNALRSIRKNDVVLVITNPPTMPLIACMVCKLRGAKMVLRLEDIYPEVLVAAQIIKADSAVAGIINAVQKNIYQRSDRILVLGREMMELVYEKTGHRLKQVDLIPHWADSDQIGPLPREENPLLSHLGILDKFVIQYSGNMGRTHDLESLVQCARILEKESNIHFLFIGSGAKEPWLKKTVSELGMRNVTILPPQPRSELCLSLNACDMALISFVKGMAGASVPSRMYNIMSAGKPILGVAEKESELARVISEENIGWVAAPGSPERIARVIMEAHANRPLLQKMSVNARQAVLDKYNQPMIMRKHHEWMDTYYA